MSNKLLQQYTNTGAILPEYQVKKLPPNQMVSYLRRRLQQGDQSHFYRLKRYESIALPTPEMINKYIEQNIQNGYRVDNRLTHLMTTDQIKSYIYDGQDYGELPNEQERILNMTSEEQQEYLIKKLEGGRKYLIEYEWELLEPNTALEHYKIIGKLNIYFDGVPENLKPTIARVIGMSGAHSIASFFSNNPGEDGLFDIYIQSKIMYHPQRIDSLEVELMSDSQVEKYIKNAILRVKTNDNFFIFPRDLFNREELVKKYITDNPEVTIDGQAIAKA